MYKIPDDLGNYTNVFVSVAGSHAQNSADERSDVDYHAVYIQPTSERCSLKIKNSDSMCDVGAHVDYTAYEIEKYLRMILKSNCNALEDINSPIILHRDKQYFKSLKAVADRCVTKNMFACYQGITVGVKKRILYEQYDDRAFKKHHRNMFRNLFTGIHAITTGEIIMDYQKLKEMFDFEEPEYDKWQRDFERYMFDLQWAYDHSDLRSEIEPDAMDIANDLLLQVRLQNW
jgi:predicted nucleotidyltransferase